MARSVSSLGEARLAKEQALAKLRQLQSAALEGRLLNAVEVRTVWLCEGVRRRGRKQRPNLLPAVETRGELVAPLAGDGDVFHRVADRGVAEVILDRHDIGLAR